ncbi:MAG: hypothetical protein EBY04_01665, partial [Actinobacteria bacterium]|nr:hypothetical protein [Actinomycetota bacterium]
MGFHSRGVTRRACAVVVFLGVVAPGCAETPRTATNFCRVLADRIDEMTTPPTNNGEVERLVDHYGRLAEVAPLEVEADFIALRDVFVAASKVNVGDAESVQALADAARRGLRHQRPPGDARAGTRGVAAGGAGGGLRAVGATGQT